MFLLCFLAQTAYIDVCDDTSYACRAKSFMTKALAANVPAITTAGIYPGVSNGASLFYALFLCYPISTTTICSQIYIKSTWITLKSTQHAMHSFK